MILKEIDSDNAGVYRKENVLIAGAEHTPPDHILVAEQMAILLQEYNQFKDKDQALKNKDLKDIKVVWKPEKIIFEDGSTLE